MRLTHAAFLNAYLASKGERTGQSGSSSPTCHATGVSFVPQTGRLTNLMQLTVDTSFWTRYRSDSLNPDFGDTLPKPSQAWLLG